MRKSFLILILLLTCILILMPPTVTIGSKSFYRPQLNLNPYGIKFSRDLDFKLGLDLQGGTHLVYQADMSKIPEVDRSSAIQATQNNLDRRVNALGVAEPLIQSSKVGDDYRLIIEMPGVKDIQQALSTIGTTAQLEFREARQATPGADVVFNPTDLTGKDLRLAQVQFGGGTGQSTGQPVVSLEFNSDGTKKFAELTEKNIGQRLAIFLDNQLVMAPTVETVIPDGKAIISGDFTVEDAKSLAIQLNAGALPVPIKIVEQRNVGASLGTESVAKSLVAGLIGFSIIMLFMVANYGFKGLIADVALILYALITLSFFKLIPVTLTLAGIAGFVLSVGMAVDANILIFERMKEELRWGRSKNAALELGFHRAWTSVRDSNVSSLITASILFWFGTGSIRGFALTLIVGILVSLFTSVTITRNLLRLFYSNKLK